MSRYVISGAAGFLGSHLAVAFLNNGDTVVGIDNLSTGSNANIELLKKFDGFNFLEKDVTESVEIEGKVDFVLHFASAASPPDYLALPIETLRVGSVGTEKMLGLAHNKDARFLLASTSEIYGDPKEHPQNEKYWGNVNSIGPRSVYDEAKRFAEAMTMAYQRDKETDTRIVRIFNTYGPRMRAHDGRVVSNFINQALANKPRTIYGDGMQTRSFCYIDDEIAGIIAALNSDYIDPLNVGNPHEFTVLQLAETVVKLLNSSSELAFEKLPTDDPIRRCPDISLIQSLTGWEPKIQLEEGIRRTADYFREV